MDKISPMERLSGAEQLVFDVGARLDRRARQARTIGGVCSALTLILGLLILSLFLFSTNLASHASLSGAISAVPDALKKLGPGLAGEAKFERVVDRSLIDVILNSVITRIG